MYIFIPNYTKTPNHAHAYVMQLGSTQLRVNFFLISEFDKNKLELLLFSGKYRIFAPLFSIPCDGKLRSIIT